MRSVFVPKGMVRADMFGSPTPKMVISPRTSPLLPIGALLETTVVKVRPLGNRAYAAAVVNSLAFDAGLKVLTVIELVDWGAAEGNH